MKELIIIAILLFCGFAVVCAEYIKPTETVVRPKEAVQPKPLVVQSTTGEISGTTLVLNHRSSGSKAAQGSIIKYVDGCRVIYVLNGYINDTGGADMATQSAIAVSDAECKQTATERK